MAKRVRSLPPLVTTEEGGVDWPMKVDNAKLKWKSVYPRSLL
jgi:hypothetical protein